MLARRRAAFLLLPALGFVAAAALRPALNAKVAPPVNLLSKEMPSPPPANPLPPATAGPPLESAAQTLLRLRTPAIGGDARAAWRAFRLAEFCETPERNRSALRDLPVSMFATLRAVLEPEAEVDAKLCEGITATQLRERRAYLLVAADGAVPGAAAALFDLGPADEESVDDRADPEVKAWEEHALAQKKEGKENRR